MTTKSSNLIVSDDGDDDGGDGGAHGAPVDFDSILHSYLHSPIFKKIFTSTYLKIIYAQPPKIKAPTPLYTAISGINALFVKLFIYCFICTDALHYRSTYELFIIYK